MPENSEDAKRSFPNLNLEALTGHVRRWIAFSGYQKEIKRVLLYRYDFSQYDLETLTYDPPIRIPSPELKRYAIVFEVSNPESFHRFVDQDQPHQERMRIIVKDTNQYELVGLKVDFSKIFFDEVYKSKGTDDQKELREEWEVFDKPVDDIDFERKTHGILWDEPAFELYNTGESGTKLISPVKTKDHTAKGRFLVPERTEWDKITITITGDNGLKAKIKTPLTTEQAAYSELGFGDGRGSGMPRDEWWLLIAFAGQGNIKPKSVPGEKTELKKLVHDLSGDLKSIFGIKENPFTRCDKKHGYSPRFQLILGIDREVWINLIKNHSASIFDQIVEERSAEVRNRATSKKRPSMDE